MSSLRGVFETPPWVYDFPLPELDVQGDFRTLQTGVFSRLVGVDGRFRGRLRRFPGFKLSDSLPPTAGLVLGGVNTSLVPFFKPMALQQAPFTTQVIRGLVFLGQNPAGTDKLFMVQSVNGAALTLETVMTFAAAPTVLDVASTGQLLYIVGSTATGKIEELARWTGASWKTAPWGGTPQTLAPGFGPSAPDLLVGYTTDSPRAGFLLRGGDYGVTYRFVFPDQGFVTRLAVPALVTAKVVSGGQPSGVFGSANVNPVAFVGFDANVFTSARVQVFRTVSQDFVGAEGQTVAGQLFLESEWEVPRQTPGAQHEVLVDPLVAYTTDLLVSTVVVPEAAFGVNVAVGDVLYMEMPYPLNETKTPQSLANTSPQTWVVVMARRTVTAKSTVGDTTTLTFTPSMTGNAFTEQSSPVTKFRVWVAKAGTGDNTQGVFPVVVPIAIGHRFKTGAGRLFSLDVPQGLPDEALALQPKLTPDEFGVFVDTPPTRFIEEYEGIMVRVTRAGGPTAESSGNDVLRWERTDLTRRGLVPVLNRRLLTDFTDALLGFIKAPPFLVGAMNNSLLRIHRSGDRLAVDPIAHRFGAISVQSMVAVGSSLYVASENGILLVDLSSNRVDVLNATQRFFDTRWRATLAQVESAYDAPTASLVFFNPALFECLILWLNHGVMSQLIDLPFERVVTSGNLRTGGLRRALFFNGTSQKFYAMNADREFAVRTTASEVSSGQTWNGTAGTGTDATNLVVGAGDDFTTALTGHFVRCHTVGGVSNIPPVRARLATFTAGPPKKFTLTPAVTGLVVGDRYSIGGLPLQATLWPLSGGEQQPLLDLYRVKSTDAMAVVAVEPSRTLSATHDKVRLQLFERTPDASVVETDVALSAASTEANFGKLARSHPILVPGFELWSSDLDIDLLGAVLTGRILGTIQDFRTLGGA